MRDRCKILDVSRAASTTATAAAAETGAEAEQTSLPCHKCRNCLHISLVIASASRRSRGERPPLLCTSHTHACIFLPFLFCLAHLANATSIPPPTHTHTHRQRRRSSACESKCCSERESERAGETTSPLAAVQASNE